MSLGKRLLNLAFAALLYVVGTLPLQLPTILIMTGEAVPPTLVALCLGLELALIAGVLWFAKWQGLISFDRIWLSKSAWGQAWLGFLAMKAFALLGVLLMGAAGQTTTANQELLEQVMAQLPTALMFLSVVIGAPIVEEVVCRGLIPAAFSGRFVLLGHLLGTLLFALVHGPTDLGSWVLYGGMGLVLAVIRHKSGRLEPAILAHFLNNAIAFVIMIVMG